MSGYRKIYVKYKPAPTYPVVRKALGLRRGR